MTSFDVSFLIWESTFAPGVRPGAINQFFVYLDKLNLKDPDNPKRTLTMGRVNFKDIVDALNVQEKQFILDQIKKYPSLQNMIATAGLDLNTWRLK
jgi:hypothetical protein